MSWIEIKWREWVEQADVLNARAGAVLVVARLGVHDEAANKQPKVGLPAVAAHGVANVEDGEAFVSNTCRPARSTSSSSIRHKLDGP